MMMKPKRRKPLFFRKTDEECKLLRTGDDRISSLPEPIIHHILSFLPNKDVKVTSLYSKTWYHISNSFPFLDFDFYASRIKRNFKQYKYLNYVDRTLLRFHKHNDLNHQIQRFSLTIPVTLFLRVAPLLLDNWIYLVLHRDILELNLDTRRIEYDDNGPSWYNLPPTVFAAKSIKVAKLGGCSLLQSFDPCSSGSTLSKLHLDHVLLDDHILSLIISTCPLIEELSIQFCTGLQRVEISNLQKLKTLEISRNSLADMVEIDVPSLQSLKIQGSVKIRVGECSKLIDLHLEDVALEDFRLQDFLLRLSFLGRLNLEGLSSLTKLQISSDTLNKLVILRCDSLEKLKIDAPNLGLLSCNSDFRIFSSIIHNVMCQWYGYSNKINPLAVEDFFVVVRNFVSRASYLKLLSLRVMIIQPISFEDLNKRSVQPVVNIDHLVLFLINLDVSEISCPDLFDCILWTCHPRTFSFHYPNNDTVMSICEAMGHRHLPCNLSRSWLHCLEEVKYVAGDGREGQLPMNGIFLASSHISSYREITLVFKW